MEILNDELVQYFIVNSDLQMSPGKVAAQVAHVATIITVKYAGKFISLIDERHIREFEQWFQNSQKKIVLTAKQKDLQSLIDKGFYYIIDNGLTEIPAGSLTVVGLNPMFKSEAQQYINKRWRLY